MPGVEGPQNLLKMLSSSAKQPIAAPSPQTTPNLERLKGPRNYYCEETGRFREHRLARESENVAEVNKVKGTAVNHKRSLGTSAASVRSLDGELARLKAGHAEEV